MKSVFAIALAFVGFTIIGTISHELGHYCVGKILGLKCSLHYASCRCMTHAELARMEYGRELFYKYKTRDSVPTELWAKYQNMEVSISKTSQLWLTLGGPIQTISTGLVGFVILLYRRKKYSFKTYDWFLVFLSLFWLRQPFNLINFFFQKLMFNTNSYFGGDELKVSRALHLWDGSIPIITGILGFIISSIVVLKLIPQCNRFAFIYGGIIGGLSGYIIWMKFLGPIILP